VAHVCVQQTVLDLLRLGFRPFVCADGVSSRRPLDRDVALDRMRQAGAVVTTCESVIFELLGEAGTDTFKKVLKIVK
jgi:nicotinamidase-related amidase